MTSTSSPLWKQLLGALGGAGVALALYAAYQVAAPPVQAAVMSWMQAAPAEKYSDADRADRQRLIVERAREILEEGKL